MKVTIMKKINNSVLIIPPYISTNWSHVKAIYLRDDIFYVSIKDGETVAIPHLSPEEIEKIFFSHAEYLDQIEPNNDPMMKNVPLRISFGAVDGLGNIMQHNPEQADSPDLPKEIIEKITSVAKIVAPEEVQNLPKPEPQCNCFHCQILQAMNPEKKEQIAENETAVSDEDLQFCQWNITPEGNKIYNVANRIDSDEQYKVCLSPLGCTCGKPGCEHIVAVLKT